MTPDEQRQIEDAVEGKRADLVGLLQALVQVPSLTGDEGAVQGVVAARMGDLGLEVDMWEPAVADLAPYFEHVGEFETLAGRPNVVGRWRGSGGGRSLILNAHIDTVETGDAERWTWPPFSGAVADGKVYGRGSCDMKGGLATHLTAIAALQSIGWEPAGDVLVESVISEEDGGAGALAAVLRPYRADAAIITEPTNLDLVIAHGGSLVFRIHVAGKSAHAAVRDQGVSAFDAFQVIDRALKAFEARRNAGIDHPLYRDIANKIPINIGVVHSGSWPSSVPDWLVAEGRAGLVPGEDLETFKAEFVAEVMAAAGTDPWLREHPPTVEWFSGQFAPSEIDADSPIVGTISAAHRAVTGSEPALAAATYGADMRHFILFGGMPCLMYGAGRVEVAHYTDEHIEIEDLVTATKTIALTIAAWSGSRD